MTYRPTYLDWERANPMLFTDRAYAQLVANKMAQAGWWLSFDLRVVEATDQPTLLFAIEAKRRL